MAVVNMQFIKHFVSFGNYAKDFMWNFSYLFLCKSYYFLSYFIDVETDFHT